MVCIVSNIGFSQEANNLFCDASMPVLIPTTVARTTAVRTCPRVSIASSHIPVIAKKSDPTRVKIATPFPLWAKAIPTAAIKNSHHGIAVRRLSIGPRANSRMILSTSRKSDRFTDLKSRLVAVFVVSSSCFHFWNFFCFFFSIFFWNSFLRIITFFRHWH